MNLELENALTVLAKVHTYADDFGVVHTVTGVTPSSPGVVEEYVQAWRTVRKYLRHAGRVK